jgi:hypothetical protein
MGIPPEVGRFLGGEAAELEKLREDLPEGEPQTDQAEANAIYS